MKRREEVLIHREACVQQKSKLETKKLCSSQVRLCLLWFNLNTITSYFINYSKKLGGHV